MTPDNFAEKIDAIKRFKEKNAAILNEWDELTKEAGSILFKACCLKEYLNECEPFYCMFRITGVCKYPEKFSELEKLLKIK